LSEVAPVALIVKELIMAISKNMARGKARELETVRKMKPSERLEMAVKLSDLCLKLEKAGAEAKRRVARKKP